MPKYLITVESGKNNIAGCALRIVKASAIINAMCIEEAMTKFERMEAENKVEYYSSRYKDLRAAQSHYGHQADYFMVSDIKLLED